MENSLEDSKLPEPKKLRKLDLVMDRIIRIVTADKRLDTILEGGKI